LNDVAVLFMQLLADSSGGSSGGERAVVVDEDIASEELGSLQSDELVDGVAQFPRQCQQVRLGAHGYGALLRLLRSRALVRSDGIPHDERCLLGILKN